MQSCGAEDTDMSIRQLKAENTRLMNKVAYMQKEITATKAALTAATEALMAEGPLIMQLQSSKGVNVKRDGDAVESNQSLVASGHRLPSAAMLQQAAQRQYCSPESPLKQNSVLQSVFSFVGKRDYTYVAGVCRLWRGRYMNFSEGTHETHWSAAITTPQRLMLAFQQGLSLMMCDQMCTFLETVMTQGQEPMQNLLMCRAKGMAWHALTASAVAAFGDLSMMQQVIALGCPWKAWFVAHNVGWRPSHVAIPMLKWLHSQPGWTLTASQRSFERAGVHGRIETIIWLRTELNAPWPQVFVSRQLRHSGLDLGGPPIKGVLICWDLSAIKWAFANGCGWGDWRCQHYDAGWYKNHKNGTERAKAVLTWAHEQEGCPCTCDDDDDSSDDEDAAH